MLCLYLVVCCRYCSTYSPTLPTGDAKLCKCRQPRFSGLETNRDAKANGLVEVFHGLHGTLKSCLEPSETTQSIFWIKSGMAIMASGLLGFVLDKAVEHTIRSTWHLSSIYGHFLVIYRRHTTLARTGNQGDDLIFIAISRRFKFLKALRSSGKISTYSAVWSKGLQLTSRWFWETRTMTGDDEDSATGATWCDEGFGIPRHSQSDCHCRETMNHVTIFLRNSRSNLS
jgi:hypothetical protein